MIVKINFFNQLSQSILWNSKKWISFLNVLPNFIKLKSRIMSFNIIRIYLTVIIFIPYFQSCKKDKNNKAVSIEQLIEESRIAFRNKDNIYNADAAIASFDSILATNIPMEKKMEAEFFKGFALLKKGKEQEAINLFTKIADAITDPYNSGTSLMPTLALAYLRLGERQNCVNNHSVESCIIPIRGGGFHKNQNGSRKAVEIYEKVLNVDPVDYGSRWLLNIAYMTLGEYPNKVPAKWLIEGIDNDYSHLNIKPFMDVSPGLGLSTRNNAGGAIVEDMDNDGYLDIVISDWSLDKHMHFFLNNKSGGFIDISEKSGLSNVTGGLNLLHADFDNDGDPDIFVLRGGWWEQFGRIPNSLLRNNGDNTFTDVTIESGLLSKHPTQTGVWRDFNNDGWLDLYIGNETTNTKDPEPCELYMNNKNGTFKEVAAIANCQVVDFIKSVASSDFNNDGLMDLFLTSAFGQRRLLKNTGISNNIPQFKDVTQESGLDDIRMRSFPSWFWDFNNDGWMDIFVCGYNFGKSIAHTAATEALGIPNDASQMYLYKNNKDGTFTNISKQAGLNKSVFAMGSNFGDIDNDGYLDMYLGTGNPEYTAIIPNRLFKNTGKESFVDITIPARVGNLQKGHGVAIADIDNDGDEDIFIEVGGAYEGDDYNNSLYLNPGQNKNNWINIRLMGMETNKSAIGSRIKLSFKENNIERSIYRDVNTGGSFGSSTLRREIGIGTAQNIDEIEITWQKSGKVQIFKNVKPNQFITLQEGESDYRVVTLNNLNFYGDSSKIIMCKPR
ncbi:MAG: FG-GAP-like repeat-containing protein [Saprospiraceae bacterium]